MKCSLSFLFTLLPFCMVAKEGTGIKHAETFQGKSQLAFIENKGQIIDQFGEHRKDIDFKLEANGKVMFVGDGQLHYQWYQSNSKVKSQKPKAAFRENRLTRESPLKGDLGVDIYRLDVELLGENPNPEVITEEQQNYTENYYLPQCPDGVTAHSYKRITYKNVYPNIDWEILASPNPSEGGGLKYNLIVREGGNYKDIQIRYNGAIKLELKDGALIATTPFGSITENAPFSYWANTKDEVSTHFVLNGNVLSYGIPSITNHQSSITNALVIDPSLRWATYYGGVANEWGMKLATDTFANAYLCGSTTSTSNIATTGAQQISYGGGQKDGYVVKFDSSGARIWATYYGGSQQDLFLAIATDIQSNIFLTGYTSSSSGIATSGSYMPARAPAMVDSTDAMLVKLNANGVRQWATYFGDTSGDSGSAIACDANGNVYIGGQTASQQNIASSGAYQTSFPGNTPGFLAKFSNNGLFQWCTYYNGYVNDIACDTPNKVYICGETLNPIGIATTGSFQSSCPNCAFSGTNNGYLAMFNSSGTRVWGSYYNQLASVKTIACDASGYIYIGGTTANATGFATAGAHQTAADFSIPGWTTEGFIAKFSPTGTRIWGSFYGGCRLDAIQEISINEKGDVFAMGFTGSSNRIATANGFKTTISYQGDSVFALDAFLVIMDPYGQRKWAIYYGGTDYERINSSYNLFERDGGAGYSKNKLYIGGTTRSTSAIATAGAYQTVLSGNQEAFVAQFDVDTFVYIKQAFTDTAFCAGDTLRLKYGTIQQFRSTNVFTVQLSNSSGSFTSPTIIGTLSGNIKYGAIVCPIPALTPAGTGYRVRIIASAPADTSYDDMVDIKINPQVIPVASTNAPLCSGNTLNLNATPTTSGVVWNWTGPGSFSAGTQNTNITNAQTTNSGNYIVSANNNGCIRKDTVAVVVNQTPAKPNAGSNSPLCSGNTLNLTSSSTTSGVSWNWTGPAGFGNTNQNPSIPNIQTNQAGDYIVTATLGPCSSKDTATVVVNPGPTINTYVNPKDTVCAGASVTLVALVTNGGSGPSYQWYKNGNPIGGATLASYIASGLNNGDVFYCQFTPGSGTGCNGTINSGSITITVLPITNPSVTITASPDTNIWQGLKVTFTATANNCSKPAYQWKLNGNNVSGATANIWGAATLLDNDMVSCVMTCNDPCPNPKDATSNKLTIHVAAGVQGFSVSGVSIYPNPVTNELIIETPAPFMERAGVRLFDVLGREVYRGVISSAKQSVNTSALVSGTYVLQLTSSTGERVMYKVVKE